jgi:hypothetical protein
MSAKVENYELQAQWFLDEAHTRLAYAVLEDVAQIHALVGIGYALLALLRKEAPDGSTDTRTIITDTNTPRYDCQ